MLWMRARERANPSVPATTPMHHVGCFWLSAGSGIYFASRPSSQSATFGCVNNRHGRRVLKFPKATTVRLEMANNSQKGVHEITRSKKKRQKRQNKTKQNIRHPYFLLRPAVRVSGAIGAHTHRTK